MTKRPLASSGKAEEFGHPARDLPLDLDGNMIAAAAVGVQPGGEHLRDHANRRAAAIDPAHEAGMHVALSVGQHLAHELGMNLGEIFTLPWRGRLKMRAHIGWNRLPDGPLANVLDVAEHVVQHAVSLRAKLGSSLSGSRVWLASASAALPGFAAWSIDGWQLRHSFSLKYFTC